jgi:Zn-dependent protease
LNLLPIPGLDGFKIWEPWLPPDVARQAAQVGSYGFMILILLLWWGPVNRAFFNLIYHVTSAVGLSSFLISFGQAFFRFWTHTY